MWQRSEAGDTPQQSWRNAITCYQEYREQLEDFLEDYCSNLKEGLTVNEFVQDVNEHFQGDFPVNAALDLLDGAKHNLADLPFGWQVFLCEEDLEIGPMQLTMKDLIQHLDTDSELSDHTDMEEEQDQDQIPNQDQDMTSDSETSSESGSDSSTDHDPFSDASSIFSSSDSEFGYSDDSGILDKPEML